MLLAVPLLIGLLWGLGRGGQLAALERITVRYPWLLVLAFAPEVVLYTPLANHAAWAITWGPAIYSASLALLAVVLLANRRLSRGMYLIAAGLILNLVVIVANGGYMPVDGAALQRVLGPLAVRARAERTMASNTLPRDANSKLVPLSDILPLPAPWGLGNVYSVGDVLIACGALLLGREVVTPRPSSPLDPRRPGRG
jgi:hypothetical protein